VTGWLIGGNSSSNSASAQPGIGIDEQAFDAKSVRNKLETVIRPMFYQDQDQDQDQDRCIEVMHHAIALNEPFFNPERMVYQYVREAHLRRAVPRSGQGRQLWSGP